MVAGVEEQLLVVMSVRRSSGCLSCALVAARHAVGYGRVWVAGGCVCFCAKVLALPQLGRCTAIV